MKIFNLIWKQVFKKKRRHDFSPNSAFEIKEEKK